MSFTIEDNIIKTRELNYETARFGGVGHLMFNWMKRNGPKIAQIDAATGQTDSFESLLKRSTRVAIKLKQLGVQKGDIVTGCSDNHLDACIPTLASFFIGALPCNLDPALSKFEIHQLIRDVKPKILFTVTKSLDVIKDALMRANLDTKLVVFGDAKDDVLSFKEFVEPQNDEEEAAFTPLFIDNPKDTVIIYFSSGTSGFPKGICINHLYFYNHSPLAPRADTDNLDVERRNYEMTVRKSGTSFLNYGSMYWNSAGMGLFLSMMNGICRLLCKNFVASEFWHLVSKYKVSGCFLTPFQVTELVKNGKPDDVDTSCLLRLTTGGAALSKRYVFELQKLIPETDIIPTYGQTEAGVLAAFELHNKAHREYYRKNPDTVGLPVPGVWYKVVDTETEAVVGANQEGELRIKSPSIMNGYYNRDSSNRYDKDGWFKTGDVIKYDENGYIYVVDRVKEMLKYRGWHIPPAILELKLSHHPAVKWSVVIGKPHEEDGDHPMAIIVLEDSAKENTTAEEIIKYIDESVEDKQRLRGGVKLVDDIPLTPSGKVKRKELRRMVLEGHI